MNATDLRSYAEKPSGLYPRSALKVQTAGQSVTHHFADWSMLAQYKKIPGSTAEANEEPFHFFTLRVTPISRLIYNSILSIDIVVHHLALK